MQTTPQSNRKHIVIYGQTNSGKSSLFNALIQQDLAIVSDVSGTTTDPLIKSVEFLPYGPVVFVDTAGLNDTTELGEKRLEKTMKFLDRTDIAIYTIDTNNFNHDEYAKMIKEFEKRNITYLVALTKADLYKIINFKEPSKSCIEVSIKDKSSLLKLRSKLIDFLCKLEKESETLIGDLVSKGSTVLLVTPIDSAAPKGRLILPQVQVLRDCLDNGIIAVVSTENNIKKAMENSKIDLVITDSQVFSIVAEAVPQNIPLTSFSLIMAKQKGDIKILVEGAKKINSLKDGANILIAENCTHNKTHEDIGTIKIPNALKKLTGKQFNIEFCSGRDFPDLSSYDLVIHCGACMITQREMLNRIKVAEEKGVSITNYGVVLSLAAGILERSIEIFEKV